MGNQLNNQMRMEILTNCEQYFKQKLWKQLNQASFNQFSIIDKEDKDRIKYTKILTSIYKSNGPVDLKILQLDQKTNRKIACLLGLAICDALGATTQFIPFDKNRKFLIQNNFTDIRKQIQAGRLKPRHGMIAVWTDDCSMALCIADSLLLNKFELDPKHLRYMFHMWLYHGLNNGGRDVSIGLGGNIKISMDQFCQNRTQYTAEKDRYNNGNGSIMRLAPIPICYAEDKQKALTYSAQQSLTTHNGDQAKQCSKLLTSIIIQLINRPPELQNQWRQLIQSTCDAFKTQYQTVHFLAKSQQQPKWLYQYQLNDKKQKFYKFNKDIKDRNWNWKDKNFTYSKCREKDQPGYIGSYCMDALAMALHTVWFSKSFKEIALWNANMGGDCDTVGAIAGQIAGAIYGIDRYMLYLYGQMMDAKSQKYQVFLKAYKLATHSAI